jgi:pyridinium-3,5-bisthiocarboxylic acid mononucleotide nickel chelatase
MPKIAYWDCSAGIAGDMCLGALVSAGVPLDYFTQILQQLGLDHKVSLQAELVRRCDQAATKVHVKLSWSKDDPEDPAKHHTTSADSHHHHADDRHHHHHFSEIAQIIRAANLPPQVERWSLTAFSELAIAESKVHGIPPEQVHFHEVGALDAITDIVCTCAGLDWLGVEKVFCSALPTGGGFVNCEHGRLPVPAPATLQLWQMHQVPVFSNGIEQELVTPTGAALAVSLSERFGTPPTMLLQTVGLGAGDHELAIPNIVRLWIGKPIKGKLSKQVSKKKLVAPNLDSNLPNHLPAQINNSFSLESTETISIAKLEVVAVLETQVDDLSPQAMAFTMEELLNADALDVFTQPVGMKKSRSGTLITVICPRDCAIACQEILFRETSTLGIRIRLQERVILPRAIREVETLYGKARVKIAKRGDRFYTVQPEYDDCARLARQHQLPLQQIQACVKEAGEKAIDDNLFIDSNSY